MRFAWAAVLALLLALRLLSPVGFMPSFDRGAVTIVACPDFELAPATPMSHTHHGNHQPVHQPCPYAAASALGTEGEAPLLIVVAMLAAAALLLGRPYRFLERHRSRERPPLRAPPVAA